MTPLDDHQTDSPASAKRESGVGEARDYLRFKALSIGLLMLLAFILSLAVLLVPIPAAWRPQIIAAIVVSVLPLKFPVEAVLLRRWPNLLPAIQPDSELQTIADQFTAALGIRPVQIFIIETGSESFVPTTSLSELRIPRADRQSKTLSELRWQLATSLVRRKIILPEALKLIPIAGLAILSLITLTLNISPVYALIPGLAALAATFLLRPRLKDPDPALITQSALTLTPEP